MQQGDTTPTGTFGQRRENVLDAPAPDRSNPARQTTASPVRAGERIAPIATPSVATAGEATPGEAATRRLPVQAAETSAGGAVVAPDPAHRLPADAAPTASPRRRGRDERTLRNAFANAGDPSQAGLELAGYLVQQERHFQALFVIDTALKQQRAAGQAGTVPLRLARAGLLRDLARCDLAVNELRGVVRELGARRVSPATLFDLAQAEWVTGDTQAAKTTLQTLHRTHANDDWLRANANDLAVWHQRLDAARPARDPLANGDLRDMFALLRAAPDYSARLRLLNSLATPAPRGEPAAGDLDDRRPVRLRAIAIACADDSAAIRARAVHLAAANDLTDREFWTTALCDVAPVVRNFAAAGFGQLFGNRAADALVQAIAREQDPMTFQSMHAALGKALGVAPPVCDAATEAGRKAASSQWKALCEK